MKLVQRAAELEKLETILASCAGGESATVLIEGPVGCGKSELITFVVQLGIALGALVLRATGTAAERRLPLGVLGQLAAGSRAGLLTSGGRTARGGQGESMELFSTSVRRLAAPGAPVVICVDDWQHADHLSRSYLLHLAHSARASGILLVLGRTVDGRPGDPLPATDLIRLPHLVRLRPAPLTEGAVAELAEAGALPGAARDSGRLRRISGGNPLLLRALFEELGPAYGSRADTADDDGAQSQSQSQSKAQWQPEPEPDGAFGLAVLACLERNGPGTVELARALAVLGGLASPDTASALLGTPAAAVGRTVETLDRAGLLDGCRFRHPAARRTVLDATPAADLAALHARAAAVLHDAGAEAPAVAAHLLATDAPAPDWGVPVLESAAGQLLSAGHAQRALACLESAAAQVTEPEESAHIRLRAVAVAARLDPALAELRLRTPLAAARAERLGPSALGALARALTSHGRLDEAAQVLALRAAAGPVPGERGGSGGHDRPQTHGRADGYDPDPLDGLCAFPRRISMSRGESPVRRDGGGFPAYGQGRDEPVATPTALWHLPEGSPAAAVAAADDFLRGVSPGCAAVEPTLQALRTLLYLGGAQHAPHWCRHTAAEADRRGAPAWSALLRTVHAMALLRLGDLAGAEREASAALDSVPRGAGSALMSAASGTLVRARLALGRTDGAAEELARPVPDSVFASVPGLEYLRARGQFHMAASRYHAALGDFLEIGRRMRRWGLDRPVVMPWRTEAAEALHRLGESRQAERFVADQLAMPDMADPWVEGISLRARSAHQEPRKRQVMLARAAEALRRSGDRYELARTLAEFARVLQDCGETSRSVMVGRTAWHLADECGAQPLRDTIARPGPQSAAEAPAPPVTSYAELVHRLSDSERRVAALAVRGDTNREIAERLCVTVSTVEQHLTRAYRKLGITRRLELPVELQLIGAEM
ncbi:LuxR family transcriptional regulator [Streptomyces sp. A1136]|uniref:helix-turn-helix transcriptional regulator n=1 Tax=Streptomyces sp. A1136 TaxID=2563102 RepID=UPI00109EE105|nr:AAA family ATPase [Streptomyces sp. A1136]THA54606.1 helix-turn-helix transcriptional regulator [Streptomyces sp. A1136]